MGRTKQTQRRFVVRSTAATFQARKLQASSNDVIDDEDSGTMDPKTPAGKGGCLLRALYSCLRFTNKLVFKNDNGEEFVLSEDLLKQKLNEELSNVIERSNNKSADSNYGIIDDRWCWECPYR